MDKDPIVLRNVTKVYGKGHIAVRALDNVSINIKKATMVAVVGPSGSGKSTLLHLIGAMDKATSGFVEVAGRILNELNEKELTRIRREKIGFVFQTFNLISNLSALENITLPMEFVHLPYTKRMKKGKQLLEEIGLGNRMNHKPSELSGGEQQRVAIARALANDPDIILADEPTGNLDSKTGMLIFDILRKIAEKRTVVVVTHDINLAKNADNVIKINDGKIDKK